MKAKNTNKKYKCENCEHTHIGYVGDLGENNDKSGYDRLPMCSECDCENWKHKVVKV